MNLKIFKLLRKQNCVLFLFFVLAFLSSCQKGEVPDINKSYIGTWKNTSDTTNYYLIMIKADGLGEYHSRKGAKYVDITGNVFFDSYDFKIGTKNFAGEKFKTDKVPERVTVSIKPYKYYYIATFNNINYKTEIN